MGISTFISAALSLALGATFVRSAVPKLRRPKSFVIVVLNYEVLAAPLAKAYAQALPPVEFTIGALLVTGVALRPAAIVAAGMLLSFVAGVGINLARGRTIECGCFGTSRRRRIGWPLLVGDLGLLAGAGIVFALSHRRADTEAWSPVHVIGLNGAALGAVIGALCLAAAVGVAAHEAHPRRAERRVAHVTKRDF